MLTKELLEFRTRKGQVYPRLIKQGAEELELATALVARIESAVGEPRGALESDLVSQANGHPRPRVGKGMVKLLLDRAEFEEPDAEAQSDRTSWLAEAERVRRALSPDSTFEAYEAELTAVLAAAGRLEDVRHRLYQDLPERRPLISFKPITAEGLVARYDLAQVQGLLLYAERLTLEFGAVDTAELRRVLRWMRFCRLVTDVSATDVDWSLTIEGPGAVLEGAKKYGLQLASFFLVVPILTEWRVSADIQLPRRSPLALEVSHESGLKPGLEGGSGHVPPEVQTVLDRFDDPDWRLDPNPPPRPIGVNKWCVPDLAAVRDGVSVDIELFHPWHHRALPDRLDGLKLRPQPDLLLGVDRKLLRKLDCELASPQVFEFSGFVTAKGLKRALTEWWSAHK